MRAMSITNFLKLSKEEKAHHLSQQDKAMKVDERMKKLLDQRISENEAIRRAKKAGKVMDEVISNVEKSLKKRKA